MTYKESIEAMRKQAGWTEPFIGGVKILGDAAQSAGAMLIAASLMTGVGTGWLASKLTSKGKVDMENARRGYENERLKADIGYLKGRIEQEHAAQKRKQAPKNMYLL